LGLHLIATGVRRLVIGTLAAILALPVSTAGAACDDGRVELRGDWGSARFRVEIADTPETRAQGLMFVEEMPRTAGMLFVFPDERVRTFWMRNTLISLDIIYFDATGAWVSAQENAVPLDETTLPSDGPARYVLEINGGLVETFGMGDGTVMRHPAIDPDIAAWSCGDD
jgi:uncharacterized membrane protein (UPF0127 family)